MFKKILLILFIFFQSYMLYAADEFKVVLHLNSMFKLSHLQNSVTNIRKELGEKAIIKVVINGKAVQLMLKNDSRSVAIVNDMLNQNADIGLCHNAIRRNIVNKNMLIKGLQVLPQDGNVTIIKLQKAGYAYIKI